MHINHQLLNGRGNGIIFLYYVALKLKWTMSRLKIHSRERLYVQLYEFYSELLLHQIWSMVEQQTVQNNGNYNTDFENSHFYRY